MADVDPQAAMKAHKAALENYVRILGQTNDPAQHAKAKAEVDRTFNAMPNVNTPAAAGPAKAGAVSGSAPKSAWEMLMGR